MISNLKSKNNQQMKKLQEKENIIKELNYKIIELTRKNLSIISKNNFSNKINDFFKNKSNDKKYKIIEQLNTINNKLQTSIDEFEIKNKKLIFDNNALQDKIETKNNDIKNELSEIHNLHQNQINIYEKYIYDLISKLKNEIQNNANNTTNNFNNNNTYNSISKNPMIANINELEKNLRKIDQENFLLKKEIHALNCENEELTLLLNQKEEIIYKLSGDLNNIQQELANKAIPMNENINLNSTEKINQDTNNFNNNSIEKLPSEKNSLIKENELLKKNYRRIIDEINQCNYLYMLKQKEYEKIMMAMQKKIKEYKYKISLLKTKINQLYNEISFLRKNYIIRNEINENVFYKTQTEYSNNKKYFLRTHKKYS